MSPPAVQVAPTADEYSDLEMVEKYLDLRRMLEDATANFEAHTRPFKDAMALIENVFLARLNARGAENSRTDAGTVYKSSLMDARIVDRAAYLKFCFDYWQQYGEEMLHVTAIKKPVRQFIEDNPNKSPPPGIEVTFRTNVNIRRT